MENYVLAMYDIRGKQEFIFRSNHIKEIVGGSAIIRDCFESYLYPSAEDICKKGIFHNREIPFTIEGFQKHMQEGYLGELVYDGGGNFLLLMKDKETFRKVTYHFTKKIMEDTSTLKVLGTYIENVDFSNYPKDSSRLYAKHRIQEAQESSVPPYGSLPIVQVDYATSMPLTHKIKWAQQRELKVSKESKAKYDKYNEEIKNKNEEIGETVLDNIVTKRGEESLLAVVYIDGNSMGKKVENCFNEEKNKSYEYCVKKLRELSAEIQKIYIDDRKKDIDNLLQKKYQDKIKRRLVVYAGDEINFICNARDAYDIVKNYLEKLPEGHSSCAGIAIFHSHAPYSDAYRIAEECCESGKEKMRDNEIEEISFMDFHYCQGAIGTSLKNIRKEECGDIISKPWVVHVSENDKDKEKAKEFINIEVVEKVQKFLNQIGRSNVKGLAEFALKNTVEFELELRRIYAHMDTEKRKEVNWDDINQLNSDKKRKLIYDMVIMYDLWFEKEEKA